MYFPNLDELSFLKVRAFPNASRIGLLCNTCCSIHTISSWPSFLGLKDWRRLVNSCEYETVIFRVSDGCESSHRKSKL
jgi:hypothetical protein